MAKLPNFIEKERVFLSTIKFVVTESIRGSKKYSILRYITSLSVAVFSFVELGALALIVNEFVTHGIQGARISVIVGGFLLMILLDFLPAILSSFQNYVWGVQIDDMERHLQSLFFIKMNELDIGTVEQSEFQNMLENVRNRGWSSFYSTNNLITNSLGHLTTVIASAVSLAIISPFALLIIFGGSLPTYFLRRKNSKLMASVWKENSEKWRIWHAKVSPISNKNPLIELKNFNLVKVFLKKFLSAIKPFHDQVKGLNRRQVKNDFIARVALTVAFGGAFVLLIHGVYTGAIIIGTLVFSFSAVSRFQGSINQLFDNFGRFSEHKKNLDTFMDFIEMKPLIDSGNRELEDPKNIHLELKNVSFSYPGSEKKVLENISLSIRQGDSIAIVGLNGAGKTTLIKLLTRVYDPTKGKIIANGLALQEYDLGEWRKCMGILLQDYSLYSEESIAENIMLGDVSKHDQEEAERSAKETTADEFIQELSQKYSQRVGTEFRGGVELSKGQKQKLALARVLYRNAPIVILDEPTASIDAVSEDTIFKNLRKNHNNQTRIIISHKFSNVRDADKIILIQDGKILEQGDHEELLALNGKYAELFNIQAEGYR